MNSRIIIALLILGVMAVSGQAALVAYWPLEEGSGVETAASFCSPASANGTLSANISWVTDDLAPVPGSTAAAVAFEATGVSGDNIGIIATQYPGIPGSAARSVSAWIKADTSQTENAVILSYGTNANGQRFTFRLNGSGVLRLEVQGGYAYATTPVNDGQWHHVAITVDQDANVNETRFYVDGQPDPMAAAGARAIDTGAAWPVSIGGSLHGAAYNFDGLIDEVMLFDHVLTPAEVMTLARGRNPYNPDPSPCQGDVELGQVLSWFAPVDPNSGQPDAAVTGYDIYLGTDEDAVRGADTSDTTGIYRGSQPAADLDYNPGQDGGAELLSDHRWFWRVDSRLDTGQTVTGLVWSFETVKNKPVILQQPADAAGFPGETVILSLVPRDNPDTIHYQWYRGLPGQAASPVGDDAPSLALTVDSVDAEGYYYCTLTNSAGSLDSEPAYLTVKRTIGHWKFDGDLTNEIASGGDGFMVLDSVPVALDPNYLPGADGLALELTGTGPIVQVADSVERYNFYPRGLTVSAWCNTLQAGYGALVGKQFRAESPWTGFLLNKNNGPIFNIRGHAVQPLVSSSDDIADGQWHLIVGTYDQPTGTARIYVDGVLAAQTTDQTLVVPTTDMPLVFGRESIDSQGYYQGLLDDVRIYNYSLDPVTVAQMYHAVTGESVCVELPENDFNGDCIVNLEDFSLMITVWLNCNLVPESNCFQ